jgi:hypothetical protein
MRAIILVILMITYFVSSDVMAQIKPCQHADPALKKLYQEVSNSESPKTWNRIYTQATQARSTLQHRKIWRQKDEGCLIAVQSEATFYLSALKKENHLLWSARALGHIILLQAWYPHLKTNSQWKIRWKTIRSRVYQALKSQRKRTKSTHTPWINAKGHSWVNIPVLPHTVTLLLSPNNHKSWAKLCGLSKACQQPLQWRLELAAGKAQTLYLPTGSYKVAWTGACARSQSQVIINAKTKSLPKPILSCFSQVHMQDFTSNHTIQSVYIREITKERSSKQRILAENPSKIKASKSLMIEASGYHSQQIKIPNDGSAITVKLHRCQINLAWDIRPNVDFANLPTQAIWGREQSVLLKTKGYIEQKYRFILPRPTQCRTKAFPLHVQLVRKISFFAHNQQGLNIPLNYLEVGGSVVSQQEKYFFRPPGTYRIKARAEGYQPLLTHYSVSDCSHLGTKVCTKSRLQLNFKKPSIKNDYVADYLKSSGLILTSSALLLGGYTYLAVRHYPQLLGRTYYQDIEREVERWSYAASSILVSGVLTYTLGHLWPYLSTDR